jgi:hypothetical protein
MTEHDYKLGFGGWGGGWLSIIKVVGSVSREHERLQHRFVTFLHMLHDIGNSYLENEDKIDSKVNFN